MFSDLYRQVFDTLTDGVFVVDRECRIQAFNPAAERMTGYTAAEAINKICYRLFQTRICEQACKVSELIQEGERTTTARLNITRKDGQRVPILLTITLMSDESGRPAGAVMLFRDMTAIEELQERLLRHSQVMDIVTIHPSMQKILQLLPDIAASDCSVLVQGPSGSGKELVSKAIHQLSPRSHGPYIRINCGALPGTLLESELFGYSQGAFTDAKQTKPGMFALANDGTLLLDEISSMELSLQVKLLRVLQDGEYQPLGSTKPQKTNARIIANTNINLEHAAAEGGFRSDLYYRINVVTIDIPSLRERQEDIPHLVDHFIRQLREHTRKPVDHASPECLALLRKYPFPGNVRELRNAIEHAFVMCHDTILMPEHLPQRIRDSASMDLNLEEEKDERLAILDALKRHKGNRALAAEELGMHRTTLWRKLQKIGRE